MHARHMYIIHSHLQCISVILIYILHILSNVKIGFRDRSSIATFCFLPKECRCIHSPLYMVVSAACNPVSFLFFFVWLCMCISMPAARGEIRTLITIIIKGSPDDCSKHKIEREVIEHLEGLTNSKDEIQVTFWGRYDSIQVMLLLPLRTLGHLLCLAVHNPELLRGLDILQIIDISSLTIIDLRDTTGKLL